MGTKRYKCPSCKKKIKLDASRDFGFCTYCGAKIQIKRNPATPSQVVQNDIRQTTDKPQIKKPWYKKWWIWVIIGGTFLFFISVISTTVNNASKQSIKNDYFDDMDIFIEEETETTTEKETETTTEKETETTTKKEIETTTVPPKPSIPLVDGFNTLQSVFLSIQTDWTMEYVKNISEGSGLYAFIDEGEESDSGEIYTKCIQIAEAPYIDTNYGSEKYEFAGDYIWLVYTLTQSGGYVLKTGDYVIASNGIRVSLSGSLSRGITGSVPRPEPEVHTLSELLRYALDKPRYNGGNW